MQKIVIFFFRRKGMEKKKIMGMNPLKVLFAMEYVLQGLANPFQGITYHSFFKHFHFTYGMTEAATQDFFQNPICPGVSSR